MSMTVYDTRTRLHRLVLKAKRFLASRLEYAAVKRPAAARLIQRYQYQGRRRILTGEVQVTRNTPEKNRDYTLREQFQRATASAPVHETGIGILRVDAWSWKGMDPWSEKTQRRINNALLVNTGAEGPLAP